MVSLLGLLLGLVLLIAGGTLLVRGASQIASRLGVSPMVVGLTIVGFGTSAPELVVNVIGALRGETGLAFGNVVGSNISNLSLVLGAAALFQVMTIRSELVLREVPLLLLATTAITVMALDTVLDGGTATLSRSDSIVLLLLFGIFLYITALDFMRTRRRDVIVGQVAENPVVAAPPPGRYGWAQSVAGFALLFVGGEATIRNGVVLAEVLGVAPTLVGLFLVAVGTSMPELVTSIIAAVRGESDLALGNVIGSNIFNALFVLPVSGIVAPVVIPAGGVVDLLFSWALAGVMIPLFLLGHARLGRGSGVLLLLAYGAYAAFRITQS